MKLSTQMPTLNIFELRQRFRKSLLRWIDFGDIGFLLARVYRLKVTKFHMLWMMQSFHLAIAKVKYLRTWNFPPKCPPSTSFELRQRFRKSVEYLWRDRIFSSTVYRLKVAKFQMLSMRKVFTLPWQNWNTLRTIKPYTQIAHPQHLQAEAKISKIGWISLEILDFCWHSVQVEIGKISNIGDTQNFHHAIAKIKHLLTWNFTPKFRLSTSWSWDKDFENPFNTFGDKGFFLAQCTCWK